MAAMSIGSWSSADPSTLVLHRRASASELNAFRHSDTSPCPISQESRGLATVFAFLMDKNDYPPLIAAYCIR
jgi:hypothetical protein